jgi:hypothetical protein
MADASATNTDSRRADMMIINQSMLSFRMEQRGSCLCVQYKYTIQYTVNDGCIQYCVACGNCGIFMANWSLVVVVSACVRVRYDCMY